VATIRENQLNKFNKNYSMIDMSR